MFGRPSPSLPRRPADSGSMYCPPPEIDQQDIKKRPPHLLPRTPTVLPYHVSDTVPVDNPLSVKPVRSRPPGASPVLPIKAAPPVPLRVTKPMIANPAARSAKPLPKPKPKPKPLPRPPSLEKRVPQPIPNYTDACEGMIQIPSLWFFHFVNVLFLCTIFMIELLLVTINTVIKNNKNVFFSFTDRRR